MQVSLSYAVLFLTMCASTQPTERAILRSSKTAAVSGFVAGAFILAHIIFQSLIAIVSETPETWFRVFGLQKFSTPSVVARSLVPDALLFVFSFWVRAELARELNAMKDDEGPRSTAINTWLHEMLSAVLGLTEHELRKSAQKWWRLLGLICCAVTGYSANGVVQFFLFISVCTRFVGGQGDVRMSKWTRFQHRISTTEKMQICTYIIIVGSYIFTSLENTSQVLENSKVAQILGFWKIGNGGRICCMSASETVGFVFAWLANICFAVAVSYGDTDVSFTFTELAGFSVKRETYRPLLYVPYVAAAMTFTGLANVRGFSISVIQIVDVSTVLLTTLWMLASARRLVCKSGIGAFSEKWVFRLRIVLARYLEFQYAYLAFLYIWNIPKVAEALTKAWPVNLRRNLTPYDFGLIPVTALHSWKHMYHRYLTIMLCAMLWYWLDKCVKAEDGDEMNLHAYIGEDSQRSEDGLFRAKAMHENAETTKRTDDMSPFEIVYQAYACMMKHVRDSLGDKFEAILHQSSMEVLLLVATIAVAFRVDVLSVLYVVMIMFACIELAVPTNRGKPPKPLRQGTLGMLKTALRVLTDAWRYIKRLRRRNGSQITSEDCEVTPPPKTNARRVRESDYRHAQSMSIHTEVNDYGFWLALLAVISIVSKQITLLTVFQSGSLNTLVNERWGSWLGFISLYDSRLEDALETSRTCCAWPYVLDAAGTFCYDAGVIASASNQFPTRACLTFSTNWYIFGVYYMVVIFAVLHGFLQRRHNVKAQMKTKAATASSVPRASYWAKLRGEVRGCDAAKKLKLLIIAERMKKYTTPEKKKKIATKDEGFSPMVAQTPIRGEEDVFADLQRALNDANSEELARTATGKEHLGWRPMVVRAVHRFVHWDLRSKFEVLDSVIDELGSLKYLLAMAVLLISAFLKSDVTSSVYIIILGYFLTFNNRDGIVRFQSQGYAIVLIIGAVLVVHVLAALRLPSLWLGTNYCENCPEKRFWLDVGSCPSSSIYAPSPPPPASAVAYSCNSRPVWVQAYEIVADVLVILLVAHYVRRGHKNMVRADVRAAWMRGYMRAKGQQMGNSWVHSEQFTRLADKVNKRLAERRKLDETAELSFDEKVKLWDNVSAQLEEYVPVPEKAQEREEMKRAEWTSRRLSRQLTYASETQAIQRRYSFALIASMARRDKKLQQYGRSEALMTQYFHGLFHKYLLMLIVILTYVATVSQGKSDFVSLGYACISILFTTRYNGLRINVRLFPTHKHGWWNGELFRLLPTYIFLVLTSKLVYQIPYLKPKLLSGTTAFVGACVEGTRKCETINALFGIRKLGSACDASMLASDCVPVLSFRSGSIGVDIILFILCSVQTQLFSDERYVREILKLEKQELDRVARRTLFYRKYVLGWRAKTQREMDSEYQTIADKVRHSASATAEWTQFQRFRKSVDHEQMITTYVPHSVTVVPKSATTVEVSWKMDSAARDIEQFAIKRERHPRTTIFPHFVNPVRVDVDPESRSACKVVVADLTPGANYAFTVQACSKKYGYGPDSKESGVVTMPLREDDDGGDEPSTEGTFITVIMRGYRFAMDAFSTILDPALYPRPQKSGDSEWTRKGDWGDSNIITGLGKIIFSQSELLVYISVVLNFVDHMDLMSICVVLFLVSFAAMWNPHPSPRTWMGIFWYSVGVYFVRMLVQSRVFCMQLKDGASADDRNRWYISAQPSCPTSTLYDHRVDGSYSTLSATLLTVPRGRSKVRDEVWTDIILILSLVLHLAHLRALGQRSHRDTKLLHPRKDYEEFNKVIFDTDEDLRLLRSTTPTLPKIRDDVEPVKQGSMEKRPSQLSREQRKLRRHIGKFLGMFGRIKKFWYFLARTFFTLIEQICLQNSAKVPRQIVGKPGVDLHALEVFLQLIIGIWFVTDYNNLVFASGTALSSTESFGTGLTISIACSVAWMILTRLVYLTRNVRAKLFLHMTVSALYVLLIFLFLPLFDSRAYMSPRHNSHLKWFTALMLTYFFVSAMQLREGFREGSQFKIMIMRFGPSSLGRLLYSLVNLIPFLFEIRSLLDWTVSDTSLDFFMWFRYEALYYALHKTSLVISFRKNKRQYYGGARPVPRVLKIILGGGTVAIIILLLTGPIFIFSTFNPALESNRVDTAQMSVQLDVVANAKTERQQLYTGFATGYPMSSDSEDAIKEELLSSLTYRSIDSDCVRFPRYSTTPWISPIDARTMLASTLTTMASASECKATLTFSAEFTRNGPPKAKAVSIDLVSSLSNADCSALATIINNGSGSLVLNAVVPRGFHLTPATDVEIIDRVTSAYIGVNVSLTSTTRDYMWSVTPTGKYFPSVLNDFCGTDVSTPSTDRGVLFATVSDRYLVGLVTSLGLSSYSIRALYAFVFITVGYFVRSLFKFQLDDAFINEISNVDELVNVCRGLRLIRALDYPGRRRDEMKMYYALMRMVREASMRRVLTRNPDEI